MATLDSDAAVAVDPGAGSVLRVVVPAGIAAAVGSILVFLGVTDLASFVYGYRPAAAPLAVLYGRAFLVAATGWTLLAWALYRVGRGLIGSR